MNTPLIDHLSKYDYEHVYEPAEDSFLLLDALEADLDYLQALEPRVCLEIGSGSGVVVTALAKKLTTTLCMATDINIHACKATKRTARHNATDVETMRCNLADMLRPQSIDLLLFNPPYVVTTDEELHQKTMNGYGSTQTRSDLIQSWAGGMHGRRIIDDLVRKLNAVLSPSGVLYILLLRENKPDQLIQELKELHFTATKYMERRIPGEYLYIVKVTRSQSPSVMARN